MYFCCLNILTVSNVILMINQIQAAVSAPTKKAIFQKIPSHSPVGHKLPLTNASNRKLGTPIAVASSTPVPFITQPQPLPLPLNTHPIVLREYPDEPINYNFQYTVNDPITGDIKEHKEMRQDDIVQGFYSLIEPDGRKRIVTYNANKADGFNAVVTHEGVANFIPNPSNAVHNAVKRVNVIPSPNSLKPAPVLLKTQFGIKNNIPIEKMEQISNNQISPNTPPIGVVSHVAVHGPSFSYKYKK